MFLALKLHPDSRCAAVTGIEVEATRTARASLKLHYVAAGRPGDVRLPHMAVPKRSDELWRTTCFEAFIRGAPGGFYCEFNFAPSMQWAAYKFDAYRTGMRVLEKFEPSRIDIRSDATRFELEAELDLASLSDLSGAISWQLALSAVIEETSGNKSYWALRHPPGKPDFHHSDCFALELPAP